MTKSNGLSTFRLVPNETGSGYRLFLNDQDISAGVQEVEVNFKVKAGQRPKIRLILMGHVIVPENIPGVVIIDQGE